METQDDAQRAHAFLLSGDLQQDEYNSRWSQPSSVAPPGLEIFPPILSRARWRGGLEICEASRAMVRPPSFAARRMGDPALGMGRSVVEPAGRRESVIAGYLVQS